jgi:hypothetical protein
MSWKLAAAAVTLRDQVNKRYPKRDRASDGTIGDRHTGAASDHNPDKTGYVMALDLDEDGWPAHKFADQLIEYMRTSGDKRIRTSSTRDASPRAPTPTNCGCGARRRASGTSTIST